STRRMTSSSSAMRPAAEPMRASWSRPGRRPSALTPACPAGKPYAPRTPPDGLRLRRPRMEGRSSPPHENRPPRRSSGTSDVELRLARLAGEALGLSAVMIARRQGDTAVVAAAWPLRGEDAEVPVAERLV